jgi:hypothetical protein
MEISKIAIALLVHSKTIGATDYTDLRLIVSADLSLELRVVTESSPMVHVF